MHAMLAQHGLHGTVSMMAEWSRSEVRIALLASGNATWPPALR